MAFCQALKTNACTGKEAFARPANENARFHWPELRH
jgi:hypothetical protein